jgi:hypothetical protein
LGAPRKWGKKGDSQMSYLNSMTLVGFVAADEFLAIHVRGQWRDISEEDRREQRVQPAARIPAPEQYRTEAGETIWAVTESDRSVTTLLLPSEY